jgi:hypothetical protein
MDRDADTARVAGKWAVRRGVNLVKSGAERTAELTVGITRKGQEAIRSLRSGR